MKVTLEYNLPEEHEEYALAMEGARNKGKLEDLWEQIFRPRHKHGYPNQELHKLINSKNGNKLMDLLEEIYKGIVYEE